MYIKGKVRWGGGGRANTSHIKSVIKSAIYATTLIFYKHLPAFVVNSQCKEVNLKVLNMTERQVQVISR